ncbi:RDD family protein [Roseateles sp. BYS78W]|uniref:RDD family protein n=1 Tax=Pelomonas candidula TaxID=3299025 RepID=A0ABW7HFQ7_9BURK
MSELADERFAPPQAHVEDLATGEVMLAGRGTRLLAVVVDTVIAAALGWAAGMIPVLQQAFLVQTQATAKSMWSLTPWSAGLGLLVFLLVQGWPLVTRGQTVGKMLLKLRIVRPDGSRPDAWRLLGLRYGIGIVSNLNPIVAMVYGLIDSLLIFRGSRKCLHDTIADTQVIRL